MKTYPKIGIRPTIDGRQGGIRESLEEKTMSLAKAVKELIEKNLRNGDGSPVECVIADTTIGRVAESAACAEKFEREGVGSSITVTSCWCYGSETMDMNPYYPKAVWGFNGTERPGAVYLAAVLAAHAQKGLPAFGIYGHDVQDLPDNTIPADAAEKILRWARAAQAVATMRGQSYLSLGNTCMGIAGSIVDADFFQEYFGIRTEYVDLVEILRRVDYGIYDKPASPYCNEFRQLLQHLGDYAKMGVHGSYYSSEEPARLEREIQRLSDILHRPIVRNRFHFLRFNLPYAYRNLVQRSVLHDYSMGYAEQPGFRCGTCTTVPFFDLNSDQESQLSMHPFVVMDATFNRYMRVSPDEAIKLTRALMDEVREVQGTFSCVFHNQNLSDDFEWKGWRVLYEDVLEYATRQ